MKLSKAAKRENVKGYNHKKLKTYERIKYFYRNLALPFQTEVQRRQKMDPTLRESNGSERKCERRKILYSIIKNSCEAENDSPSNVIELFFDQLFTKYSSYRNCRLQIESEAYLYLSNLGFTYSSWNVCCRCKVAATNHATIVH